MDLRGFEDEDEYWEIGASASPKKKVVIPALCLSLIAALLVFRGVFAANIGINSAANVEFGQGVTIATSCDSQVTLTPYASFVNSGSGAGTFKFSSFKLSNVNVAACNGVTFTLKAYDSSTANSLTLFSTNSSASVIDTNTSFSVAQNQSGLNLIDTATSGAFTAQFASPVAAASNVYKLTLETSGNGNSSVASVTVSAFNFTAISAGWTDTCGIITSGSVYCWGRNGYGQLGNGTTNGDSNIPVLVSNLANATQISVGNSHACAMLSNGTIWCWGNNGNGFLGNGTTTDSNVPVQSTGITTSTNIGIGNAVSCARLSNGSGDCWGYDWSGQTGNGSLSTATVSLPTQVGSVTNFTQVVGGQNISCGLLTTGRVNCWGLGPNGRLGDGGSYCGSCGTVTPVTVYGITTATQISVSDDYGCALLADNTIKCWGLNQSGQVGNGTNTSTTTPVSVSGITTATFVSSGTFDSCAILTGGSVECWGSYGSGMLGTNTNTDSYTPVLIAGISNVTSLSVGNSHVCAIISGGQVKCWGDNSYGQFGNGTTNSSASPS